MREVRYLQRTAVTRRGTEERFSRDMEVIYRHSAAGWDVEYRQVGLAGLPPGGQRVANGSAVIADGGARVAVTSGTGESRSLPVASADMRTKLSARLPGVTSELRAARFPVPQHDPSVVGPIIAAGAAERTVRLIGARLTTTDTRGDRKFLTPDGRGEFYVSAAGSLMREVMRDDSAAVDTRHEYAVLPDGTVFRTRSTTTVYGKADRDLVEIDIQISNLEVAR
jgi:hypothetical protein